MTVSSGSLPLKEYPDGQDESDHQSRCDVREKVGLRLKRWWVGPPLHPNQRRLHFSGCIECGLAFRSWVLGCPPTLFGIRRTGPLQVMAAPHGTNNSCKQENHSLIGRR